MQMNSMSTVNNSPFFNKLEVWGGPECTINRINNSFHDQLDVTGHYKRPGDIEAFASLGIRKMRYPVLWEKHQPQPGKIINWNWTAQRLQNIKELNIDPIAGLLHHGSGPVFTDLLDTEFPAKLAAYAQQVAETFPWLQYYTPVNEPLTTARFSGLYGWWYPHKKNELCFVKMLLNQLKGIVLSMRAVRKINPYAKLVQTEDLAKIHSTPALSHQANFENNRKWLTYDILCGKLDQQHYFWKYFIELGIPECDLHFFLQNTCEPDIMGFNYYVTSERFLDENTEQYPQYTHGGNEKMKYADTEAVRVIKPAGIASLLTEAWDRYGIPLAVTECHLSCSCHEQMRWLKETWDACCTIKKKGVDVRAVTAWSLLGSYDWNSLLTCCNGEYEAGVFDVRDMVRHVTPLVKLIRSLATTGEYEHDVFAQKGWWRSSNKLMEPSII